MQRGRNKTVTHDFKLPVLVSGGPERSDGFATFFRTLTPPIKIRVFNNSELRTARAHLGEAEVDHFVALWDLKNGLEGRGDVKSLQRAITRLSSYYAAKRVEPNELQKFVDEAFTRDANKHKLSAEEACDVLRGARPSLRALSDLPCLLSEEISEMLNVSSRIVLWWTGERFTPAIWCEDIKTAFYVRVLLDIGGKGLRICPHCGNIFFPNRTDQSYCSVSHREAHRVARWRARRRSSAKEKGGKRVPRKTR